MKNSILIAAALLVVALPATTFASGEGWYEDFDAAAKVAKAEGKDLLVDFSGSDWCGWCVKLDNEVFKHASFLDPVKKDFVLVVLDFPRGEAAKAKVPNPARNEELKNQWKITGFPTVLLMNADGGVYGKTGYKAGGPENYVTHLNEMREKLRPGLEKATAVAASVAAATGAKKIEAITAALDLMDEVKDAPYAASLVPGVKAAIEVDADNAKGLKLRALKLLLSSGNADEATMAAARTMDPKNEQGLLEQVVAAMAGQVRSKEQLAPAVAEIEALFALSEVKDHDVAVALRTNAMFWCFKFLDKPEEAKAHATALKALNPENPRLQALIKQVLGE